MSVLLENGKNLPEKFKYIYIIAREEVCIFIWIEIFR